MKQKQDAPLYTRAQLIRCPRLGASPDVAMAALREDKTYTMDQAKRVVAEFLKRKV